MKIDLHTHSIASGHAINTIHELINHAKAKGMTHLGITDHGPSMEGAPHEGYFWISGKIPIKIDNVNIYMGVEANIIDVSGKLDLSIDLLKKQKIVSAGIHQRTTYRGNSRNVNTEAIINTINSGLCNIITHPVRVDFPVDSEPIAEAAIDKNVLLELNNQVFENMNDYLIGEYKKMVRFIRDKHGYIIIGSDSHTHFTLGDDSNIMRYFDAIGLTWEIVINNYPKKLEEYIK
jgi:putative hydrolase